MNEGQPEKTYPVYPNRGLYKQKIGRDFEDDEERARYIDSLIAGLRGFASSPDPDNEPA